MNFVKTVETALLKCADINGEFPTITNMKEEKMFIKKLLNTGVVRRLYTKALLRRFLGL